MLLKYQLVLKFNSVSVTACNVFVLAVNEREERVNDITFELIISFSR